MLIKEMKKKFINTLSNRIIKELGSEKFGDYIKENLSNLPRTKNYLEQLSDEIYIDYQNTFDFDESFNKSIRNFSASGSSLFWSKKTSKLKMELILKQKCLL